MVIYGFADYGMILYVMTLKRMKSVLSRWRGKISLNSQILMLRIWLRRIIWLFIWQLGMGCISYALIMKVCVRVRLCWLCWRRIRRHFIQVLKIKWLVCFGMINNKYFGSVHLAGESWNLILVIVCIVGYGKILALGWMV